MIQKLLVRMSLLLAIITGSVAANLYVYPPNNDSVMVGDSIEFDFRVMNGDMEATNPPAMTTFSVTGLQTGWSATVIAPTESPYPIPANYGQVYVTVRVIASPSINVGDTTTVTLNAESGGTFSASAMVKAIKGNQTISFAPLADKAYIDAPFKLTAMASSGLTVSYASSDPGVATVSHDTVTIVGMGTTTITASQAGNANFNAAPDVEQTLTITKAPQTITFDALIEKTRGDAPFALTATASSGLPVSYASSNTAVATISGSTVTIITAGTTVITASQAGNANYDSATSVQQTLTVNGTPQTITFNTLANKTYLDAPFALTATATSGLHVSFSSSNTAVATISDTTVTIVGAGSTIITASQAGDADWSAAPEVQRTLTVNKADQTITFGALAGKMYGDTAFTLTATTSSGLAVSYASSDTNVAKFSGSWVTITGVGTATITASQNGNTNYNAATNVQQTLTVIKGNQTITFDLVPNCAFGAPFVLTATASSNLLISYVSTNPAIATANDSILTMRAVGTTTIIAKQGGNANYNAAPDVERTFTVVKGSQTITFDTIPDRKYGDAPFSLEATTSSHLPVSYASSNTAVATISGSSVTIAEVGTATITASQAGDANYNAATIVQQVLTVNKGDQTINFAALPIKTIGDAAFPLTATATSGLAVSYASSNTAVATVSGTIVTIVGVGATLITASQSGDARYNPAPDSSLTLTVNKASQTITFAALPDKLPSDNPFKLTATASSGLTVTYASSNTAVATVSHDTVTIVAKGTTIITASQSGDDTYYPAPDAAQSFRVGKTDQTITFGPLPIKWVNDPAFALSASASSGLAVTYASSNTAVATVSGNTVTMLTAGTTILTASQIGNATYDSAASVAQTLTVAPDAQTITFNAIPAKAVDSLPFALTATTTSGLTIFYTSSNTDVATISGTVVTIIGAGTTTITASQSGNTQYAPAADKYQTLTVNKAGQTITFDALEDKTVDSLPFTLAATASSGLTVSYASSNTSVATVSGTIVTLTGAGTTTITASQAGNTSWNPAANVPQTLTVGKGNQVITFGPLPDSVVGGAAIELTATASSSLAVSYTSSDTAVAKISGSFAVLKGVGTTTITASQAGNTSWNPATDVQQTLTLGKGHQTITFGALPDKVVGDTPFALTATATSNLTVTYASSDPAVATVSGAIVTIHGAGTTTITASQGGNVNWNPAIDAEQTLRVKRSQTIDFVISTDFKTAGDPAFQISATATSGLTVEFSSTDTSVATVSGVWVTIVGVGTTDIIASQDGNDEYAAAAQVPRSFTVLDTIATQIITFDSLSEKTVGEDPFKLTAWATSGLAVSYTSSDTTVAKISNDTLFFVGAGTSVITASQGGDIHNYPATPVDRPLTVLPTMGTVDNAEKAIPHAFAFLGGRPNPFNPSTSIAIAVPPVGTKTNLVTLRIYDINGRMVRTLLNNPMAPGYYSVLFDGRSDKGVAISSGVYVCTMRASGFEATKTILMMK